jgi:rhodanese-related sulfurtransferase
MVLTVTPSQLVGLLADPGVDLIDVRDASEYEAGHVDGARLLPFEVLRADPDAVLARGATLVFVCAKGVRSLQAAKLAERFGHERVYSLEGGTKEWARSGMRLVSDRRVAA